MASPPQVELADNRRVGRLVARRTSRARAWDAWHELRDPGSVKAWLFTILRRENARRFERKRLELVDGDVDDIDESWDALRPIGHPENGLALREAVARLPATLVEPLLLQVLGGFDCAEIARQLDTTEGAVMTRVCRARSGAAADAGPSRNVHDHRALCEARPPMNCTDFRRAALAHGHAHFSEAGAHAGSCLACRRFADELGVENEVLQRALAVEVPQGVADRVLLSRRRGRSRLITWAAASIALATAGLLLVAVWQAHVARRRAADMAADMIDHVVAEPEALAATAALPTDRLTAALSLAGVTARTPPGQVRYAVKCKLPGGKGQHLVVDTPRGKVTIIVTPLGITTRSRQGLARAGYYVQLVPGRDAAVGVIGVDREATEATVALLKAM